MTDGTQQDRSKPPTIKDHKKTHIRLHKSLDELVADWIGYTDGMPSESTVLDLINWSYKQTVEPTE